MTETTPSTPELPSWLAQMQARSRLAEELHPANKAALFDALAQAGITEVTVHFDGYGDSGQIEEIEARTGEKTATLPSDMIEIAMPNADGSGIHKTNDSIHDAIETLVFHFLSETHCGWENNDGAYGDFVFDVSTRTISLDYNERFTDTTNSVHEF